MYFKYFSIDNFPNPKTTFPFSRIPSQIQNH
ncbi:hypothetical protein MHA_1767 [Mannheimia haemolytica PHL213]|nr:hypothetical protein MHA_1767 [Mannheimia haemolytica PHL213]